MLLVFVESGAFGGLPVVVDVCGHDPSGFLCVVGCDGVEGVLGGHVWVECFCPGCCGGGVWFAVVVGGGFGEDGEWVRR